MGENWARGVRFKQSQSNDEWVRRCAAILLGNLVTWLQLASPEKHWSVLLRVLFARIHGRTQCG
jgi:hypothetical protein